MPDRVWCKCHKLEEDYHWTSDVVGLSEADWDSRGNFSIPPTATVCAVGRECVAADVARGDLDARQVVDASLINI